METLDAPWMLPDGNALTLPDGTVIPTAVTELESEDDPAKAPRYKPVWVTTEAQANEKLPLRLSPSAIPARASARIGEVIELGERLHIEKAYDPAALGSALHAVIATSLMGQNATARVLLDHGMKETLSEAVANESTDRFVGAINQRFNPSAMHAEFPVQYINDSGQIMSGWIDLLIETSEGFVLIDHKASPRARSDWNDVALDYSGQLRAYAEGIERATGKPVISCWIHFGVTGGLVEVVDQ
jgi:ATP-dependent helicase/nuclease subunit A